MKGKTRFLATFWQPEIEWTGSDPHPSQDTYLLNQCEPLTAHLQHSQTRLDNNLVEKSLRPTKLGAKNWLFVGHPDAEDRSAIIYSLVVSCQRRDKDPHAYLRDVLTRLPKMTSKDNLSPLLPANWSAPVVTAILS